MKNITTLFLSLFSVFIFAQNFEISTLRIGDFKIFMDKPSADKIAGKSLDPKADYEVMNKVNYHGETVEVLFMNRYESESKPDVLSLYVLKTKSSKFKTKSGMGVGNTRDELLKAYKDYSNFQMISYDDPENKNQKESYFTLSDHKAGTYLSFKMLNNKVVEVSVGIDEGC